MCTENKLDNVKKEKLKNVCNIIELSDEYSLDIKIHDY